MNFFILHLFFPLIHSRINELLIVKLLTVIIIKYKIIIIEQVFMFGAKEDSNE
jgi:hypothetical protein